MAVIGKLVPTNYDGEKTERERAAHKEKPKKEYPDGYTGGHTSRTSNDPKPWPICGAINRSGGTCGNPAGKGTDHVGVGRCKFHGGRNQQPGYSGFKHGLHSQIQYPVIQELVEKLAADREIFNLRDHIYTLEAISLTMLNSGELAPASRVLVEIVKAIKTLHEIEVGRKLVVEVTDVNRLVETFAAIVNRYVTDPYTRGLIATEMSQFRLSQPRPLPEANALLEASREVIDVEAEAV